MRQLDVDPKLVAEQLGHGVDINLNVYTQSFLDQRKNAVNPFGAELARAAKQLLEDLPPDQLIWDQPEYTDMVVAKGTIENPVGFLITFLKENRPVPPTFLRSRQRALAALQELAREEIREAYDAYKEREVDRYIQEYDVEDEYPSRIAARKKLYTCYLGNRPDEELTRAARRAVQDEMAAQIPGLQSEEDFFRAHWDDRTDSMPLPCPQDEQISETSWTSQARGSLL